MMTVIGYFGEVFNTCGVQENANCRQCWIVQPVFTVVVWLYWKDCYCCSCCMCTAAVILVTMIICCVTYYSLKKEMIEAAVEKPDEEKFWDLDEERRRRAAWRNPFKRQVYSSISPFLCIWIYSCHTNVYIYRLYSHTTVFKVQFIYFILYILIYKIL